MYLLVSTGSIRHCFQQTVKRNFYCVLSKANWFETCSVYFYLCIYLFVYFLICLPTLLAIETTALNVLLYDGEC